MAYDKVIDSSVLDGNLLSIANAIREKAELTENFAFPQGFIDAISGLEVGGGAKVSYGSFTTTEKLTSGMNIEHGLGVVPDFAFVFIVKTNDASITTTYQLIESYNMSMRLANDIGLAQHERGHAREVSYNSGFNVNTSPLQAGRVIDGSNSFIRSANDSTFVIGFANYSAIAVANTTYAWIACAF